MLVGTANADSDIAARWAIGECISLKQAIGGNRPPGTLTLIAKQSGRYVVTFAWFPAIVSFPASEAIARPEGRSNMVYFTTRERRALSSVDDRSQTKQLESARDDFAPRRRAANTEIAIQQLRDAAVERVEAVIAELQHQREAILGEGARVRREIVAYAKLNQVTMDSTRVISGSLSNFNLVKAEDAPATNELIEAISVKEAVSEKEEAVSDKKPSREVREDGCERS
jgi:hypothetical protein